jgi:hypothetical protein
MKNAETTKTTTPQKPKASAAKKTAKAPPSIPPAAVVKEAKALEVRVYAKGEIYFPRLAVERLGEHKFVAVGIKGKTVTLTPTTDKKAQPVMYCHAAPVLRIAKLLAETGWSKTTQTVAVTPVGPNAMRLEVQ